MDAWPDRIPDGIEPIVGYRLWYYVNLEQPQLFSLTRFAQHSPLSDWAGAESSWVVASCLIRDDAEHVAPAENCLCGFYAMSTLGRLITEAELPVLAHGLVTGVDDSKEEGFVLGRVALAGKVIEHEYGYRAERARIDELIPIHGTEPAIIQLAAQLGLPIGNVVLLPPDTLPIRPRPPLGPGPRSAA
jgi:hypothetical protein